MLTADQNIADVDFTVLWRISDAGRYLFNIRDQEDTVKTVAESAIREVIGQSQFEDLLTGGRMRVEQETRVLLRQILDGYRLAIRIGPERAMHTQLGSASTLTSFFGFFHKPDLRLSLHSGALHDLF